MVTLQYSLRDFLIGIAVVTVVVVVGSRAFFVARQTFWHYTLDGPTSAAGFRVVVDVSDNSPGIDPSFLADVEIYDFHGTRVFRWRDPDGQKSSEGVQRLLGTMTWIGDTNLIFEHRGAFDEPSSASIQRREGGVWMATSTPIVAAAAGLPSSMPDD
jgi:hypothetical protein